MSETIHQYRDMRREITGHYAQDALLFSPNAQLAHSMIDLVRRGKRYELMQYPERQRLHLPLARVALSLAGSISNEAWAADPDTAMDSLEAEVETLRDDLAVLEEVPVTHLELSEFGPRRLSILKVNWNPQTDHMTRIAQTAMAEHAHSVLWPLPADQIEGSTARANQRIRSFNSEINSRRHYGVITANVDQVLHPRAS